MIQAGASSDEITAALVKNAKEQTPEGQNPVIGLLSAWGDFFGVPLDVVLSNEQMAQVLLWVMALATALNGELMLALTGGKVAGIPSLTPS